MSLSNATRGSKGIAFTPADLSYSILWTMNIRRLTARASTNLLCSSVIVVALKFFAGLESNRLTQRDRYFFARARIASDAALARLYNEDAKAAQLDPIASRQRVLHRIEERFNRLFGFQLWNSRLIGKSVDDIEFDHERGLQLAKDSRLLELGKLFEYARR